ncbi:hypothetical protein MUO93_10190 [Candidatus Bathyarchaeota archaeon]|nr:hypothetical protein [Candidatus Bathyarchaeota archaeon]
MEDTCYAIELNAKRAVPEWGGQEAGDEPRGGCRLHRWQAPLALWKADAALPRLLGVYHL